MSHLKGWPDKIRSTDEICKLFNWLRSGRYAYTEHTINIVVEEHTKEMLQNKRHKSNYHGIILFKQLSDEFKLSISQVYPQSQENFSKTCDALVKITKFINELIKRQKVGYDTGRTWLKFLSKNGKYQNARKVDLSINQTFEINRRILQLMANIRCPIDEISLPLNFGLIADKWHTTQINSLIIDLSSFLFMCDAKIEPFDFLAAQNNYSTLLDLFEKSRIISFDFVDSALFRFMFFVDMQLGGLLKLVERHRYQDRTFVNLIILVTNGLLCNIKKPYVSHFLPERDSKRSAWFRCLGYINAIQCGCRTEKHKECQHFKCKNDALFGEYMARLNFLNGHIKTETTSLEKIKCLDAYFEDELKNNPPQKYQYCEICHWVEDAEISHQHKTTWPYFLSGHPLYDPRLLIFIDAFAGDRKEEKPFDHNSILDRIILYEKLTKL